MSALHALREDLAEVQNLILGSTDTRHTCDERAEMLLAALRLARACEASLAHETQGDRHITASTGRVED